jgi:hypothetical protein
VRQRFIPIYPRLPGLPANGLMPRPFRPFLLNSNFCTNAAATRDYNALMATVNYNTGNSHIPCAVLNGLLGRNYAQKAFAGINNIWQADLPREADQINDNYSHVLLFLQDQIREDNDFDKWNELNDLIEQIHIPIVVFGLGANSFAGDDPDLHSRLAPGLIRFLRLLSDHTTELSIRGEFTADVLTKLGITNFRITGCPSYFECGQGRRVAKPDWNPDGKVIADGCITSYNRRPFSYPLCSQDRANWSPPRLSC